MGERDFLTGEEVSQRCRGEISGGTLRNSGAMKVGLAFAKISTAVLRPAEELDA